MKTYRHLYPQVIAWENLELAYHSARKGKRTHAPVAAFEFDRERNLTELQEELREKAYRPGPYHSFIIHEPKRRLISAAPFRDRVVHHALCNVIEPIFEPRFIFDSYANRVGKGTHRALDRCTYNSNHNIGLRVVGSHGLWVRPEMPRGRWLLRDRGKGRELGLPEERRGLLLAGGSLIPSPGEYGIALPLVVGGIICNRSPGQGNVTYRSPKQTFGLGSGPLRRFRSVDFNPARQFSDRRLVKPSTHSCLYRRVQASQPQPGQVRPVKRKWM